MAEFERDILTERIQDNLMELSKDGRFMGGTTPTGFTKERVSTGSGKNKSAVSFLVPIPEERALVQKLFRTFLKTRSLNPTAVILNEEHTIKKGAAFTVLAVKDILKNPIYCTADEQAYQYFVDMGANVYGEAKDYDGTHAISAYNRTDQMKLEDENSTFFNPKFVKAKEQKPITEWIISIGKHEGFISSSDWIAAQRMMSIAERYNRPHRKTNALLAGLIYCPYCGKRLNMAPESDRWQNGKPRFKYVCPGFRKKECTFKVVDGVLLDEFIVEKIAGLSDRDEKYTEELFRTQLNGLVQSEASVREVQGVQTTIQKLKNDIAAQVRNLREADTVLKKFIQDDISLMTQELEKQEDVLKKLTSESSLQSTVTRDLENVRAQLISFTAFSAKAKPEVLVTLLQILIERIYIVYVDGTPKCHIYLKGCLKEDYSPLFGTAEYINNMPDHIIKLFPWMLCDPDRDRQRHSHLCRRGAAACLRGTDGTAGLSGTHRTGENHARIQSALPLCTAHRRSDHQRSSNQRGQRTARLLLPLLLGAGSRKQAGKRSVLLHFHGGVSFPQRTGGRNRGSDGQRFSQNTNQCQEGDLQCFQGFGQSHLRKAARSSLSGCRRLCRTAMPW